MTGYGSAEGAVQGGRLRLEIRTVNHRYFNPALKLPSELAALVREGGPAAIGDAAQLARYRARRRLDRRGGIGFTDALVQLFSNDIAPLRLARGFGLAALGAIPPARDFLVRRMTFGARG